MKKRPGVLPTFVILKTDVMTNLRNTIITGDCLTALETLDYQSVDLVITSTININTARMTKDELSGAFRASLQNQFLGQKLN